MAVRQYAFHFNFSEGCIVFLSAVVSFLLVFAFGVYIGKEVQAYKTAQETRTVRFPVENLEDKVSASPPSHALPLILKKTLEKRSQGVQSQPPSAPPVGVNVSTTSEKVSQNKKREAALAAPVPIRVKPQDKKEQTRIPGGWSIQVHVTKSRRTAYQLAAELRKQGHTASVNTLTKNGEALYRLRVGTFTQEEAQRVAVRFRREGKFAQAYLVSD